MDNTIAHFLECAASAHERARVSKAEGARDFHERMADLWMNLAASAAWIERADLFTESMSVKKVPPADLCDVCHRTMRLLTAEVTEEEEKLTFECTACGSQRVRHLSTPRAQSNLRGSSTPLRAQNF
jgi:hypothetical protein